MIVRATVGGKYYYTIILLNFIIQEYILGCMMYKLLKSAALKPLIRLEPENLRDYVPRTQHLYSILDFGHRNKFESLILYLQLFPIIPLF